MAPRKKKVAKKKTAKKSPMMRKNEDKPKLSYMLDFPAAIEAWTRVMEAGAEKYERNNWKNGMPITEMENSLLRHLTAFHNCENNDPEIKQNHMANIMFNAAAIIEHMKRYGDEFDDRDWANEGKNNV